MTHSEEKKRGRWNVIRVSQVSAAIPYLAPQCSSLHSTAMETINYPPLTNFHHHFYGQRCSRKELPSWNCTAGAAGTCVQKEEAWKRAVTGEMAKERDEQLGKCSMVRHDGKNPLLLPISSLIAGIREDLDISKAWRDFSWGLCLDKVRWAGFKVQSLS